MQSGAIDDCHSIAHRIGEELFALRQPLDLLDDAAAQSFSICSGMCLDGCRHGVLGRFVEQLMQDQAIDSIDDRILQFCGRFTQHHLLYACIHGLGHGLQYHSSRNTDNHAVLGITKALQMCSNFSSSRGCEWCGTAIAQHHINTEVACRAGAMMQWCVVIHRMQSLHSIC